MNKLLLLSGNDLPFVKGGITIHQPRLKEIAFLGQDLFYLGNSFICFSKDSLPQQDKVNLTNKTNFDVLMSIVNNKADITKRNVLSFELVLSLLFPDYQLMILPTVLALTKQNKQTGKKEQCLITNSNFEDFKEIVKDMFCLNGQGTGDYNPANQMAAQIAKKLRERRQKLNKKQGVKQINILSRCISILVLANHHTFQQLMQYTVYQLFDEFRRFQKKYNYDIWLKAKMAGAQNLQDVDSWLSDQSEERKVSRPSSNRIEYT